MTGNLLRLHINLGKQNMAIKTNKVFSELR